MTFGDTLRELLGMADVKQIQLAEYLGYDVSYINKWISGQKQPSVRNNRALFQRIAKFLIKFGGEEFREQFAAGRGLPSSVPSDVLADSIVDKLTESYSQKEQKKKKASAPSYDTNCLMSRMTADYSGNQKIRDRALQAEMSENAQVMEIISLPCPEFCGSNETRKDWLNIEADLPEEKSIHVRFLTDFSDTRYSIPLCKDLCVFLYGLPERISFDIYSDNLLNNLRQGYYVYKNFLCIKFEYDPLLDTMNNITTSDPNLVSQYYSAADQYLSKKAELVKRDSFDQLYIKKYFQSFLLGRGHSSLHTVMPLLLMEKNLLDKICQRAGISTEYRGVYEFYEKTLHDWSAVIYKSAILKFIFDGKLWLMGQVVTLGPEERRAYLEGLLDRIPATGGNLTILSDTNPIINLNDISCSVFLNHSGMFSVRHYRDDSDRRIIYTNDVALVSCFQSMFDSINTLPEGFALHGASTEEFLQQCIRLS